MTIRSLIQELQKFENPDAKISFQDIATDYTYEIFRIETENNLIILEYTEN